MLWFFFRATNFKRKSVLIFEYKKNQLNLDLIFCWKNDTHQIKMTCNAQRNTDKSQVKQNRLF